MLALYENEIQEYRKVTIQYDKASRIYYCFYHRKDDLCSELILTYNLDEAKWNVDTIEFKNILEKQLNDLFHNEHIPFEEQVRYVINHLDIYFNNLSQVEKMKVNTVLPRTYSLPWYRRLSDIRRWSSQDVLTEQPSILQRYSAPEKSISKNTNEQILSVNKLSQSFHTDDLCRNRSVSSISSKAPAIGEIWLNVCIQGMDNIQEMINIYVAEGKLKKLAEKFVTYFGGTFQCNIGQKYQLEYDGKTWNFMVHKYEFCTQEIDQNTKTPKTKMIFVINDIPYYVRG